MTPIFVAIAGFVAIGFVDNRPVLRMSLLALVVVVFTATMWLTR